MLKRSDQEKPSWSLSWHPEGRCDSFTREAILLFAPAVSGVYGLFNCDYQLFIGESPNMLEALLQHEAETDFQSQQLRPTGFTFEPCAAELRKSKVDELIARFHPVLQTEAVLTEISPRLNHPNVSEGKIQPQDLADDALQSEFPLNEHEWIAQGSSDLRYQLNQRNAFTAILLGSALLILYFGIPFDFTFQKQANSANNTSGVTKISVRRSNPLPIDATELLHQQTGDRTANPQVHRDDATVHSQPFVNQNTPGGNRAGGSAKVDRSNKTWSVQVSATSVKTIADNLEQQLRVKGYDSYVVQAEVKGETYYRVRIGHFVAREEAEPLRALLASQEGYQDAYLAGDW